ncbi:MAG: citrate/2-methylcitrate synthase [Candidatus Marsarchaeota archaeon]|nr:citrate/2-methylcitrate synthase [Candidatus Marsarchaeota archaeon]
MEISTVRVAKGLERVIVDDTAISSTDSAGNLVYRGYLAVDLASKLSFEEVAYLVAYGKLPTKKELSDFSGKLLKMSSLDRGTERLLECIDKDYSPIDMLRTVVSGMELFEKDDQSCMLEMAARMPTVITRFHSKYKGRVHAKAEKGSYAERFYFEMTGKDDKKAAAYLEKLLILYMEHEFNASTFALRVTTSTLAGPQAAFTTALGTLKGPLHGGANSEVLRYMLSFKKKEDAIRFVDSKLKKKEKIMGFGHRVYKMKDPRAVFVRGQLKSLSKTKGMPQLLEYAEAIENRMWELKRIPANVDFYAALYMYLLGISEEFYLPIFAAARSFGWIAHYTEQVSNNKLIRPDSGYVGPRGLKLK